MADFVSQTQSMYNRDGSRKRCQRIGCTKDATCRVRAGVLSDVNSCDEHADSEIVHFKLIDAVATARLDYVRSVGAFHERGETLLEISVNKED